MNDNSWNPPNSQNPQYDQNPQYGQNPQFNQNPQYGQNPQFNQNPQYGQNQQYNRAPNNFAPPANPLKENRSILMYILLSIVTCGIYSWIFLYSWADEVNTACEGDGQETPGLLKFLLLNLVTCGIYQFFWYYNLEERLQDAGDRYGVRVKEGGSTVILFMILGLALAGIGYYIGLHILFKNTNAICTAYNRTVFGGGGYGNSGYNNSGFNGNGSGRF